MYWVNVIGFNEGLLTRGNTIIVVPSCAQALRLLDTRSAFYDGPCEGVYLRVDGDMPASGEGEPYCVRRGKLVRPDFLQQIEEQWTRQQFTKNIVVYGP